MVNCKWLIVNECRYLQLTHSNSRRLTNKRLTHALNG